MVTKELKGEATLWSQAEDVCQDGLGSYASYMSTARQSCLASASPASASKNSLVARIQRQRRGTRDMRRVALPVT